MKCIGVFVFGSRGNNFLSKAIIKCTRPDGWMQEAIPSHAGVIFVYQDGSMDYAEAFLGKDWAVALDIRNLKAYAQGKGQWVHAFHLPLRPDQAYRLHEMALCYRHLWHYSIPQLFRMLRHRIFSWWRIPSTPKNVVCSEAVARLVHPFIDLVSKSGRESMEDVSPVDLFVAANKLGIPIKPIQTIIKELEIA